MTILCQLVEKCPKLKKGNFWMVFGLYLLNALTKNLKIKKIKEHFERAFQQCAEIYIRKKKFLGDKNRDLICVI